MFFKLLRKLKKEEGGATAIEYGLIAALIAVVAIAGFSAVGDALWNDEGTGVFNNVEDGLNSAANGS